VGYSIRPKLIPVSEAWSDWEYFYSPLEGKLVNRRVTQSIKFTGTWVERGTERVSVFSKNTTHCPLSGLEP